MKIKLFFSAGCVLFSAQLFAFPCFFTLAKDSCWTNYDVQVVVIDANTNKTVVTVDVPKGKSWARQSFTCSPAQRFFYKATYQPVFWQSEVGKAYMSTRYWSLPATVGPTDTAWNIPVCFPANFAAVPFPPDAQGNCACDWTQVPAPPSQ
ncbi:hypothetical protein [Legionella brunensis]|uniref:Periplasmic protein n=1 Tax=Legionella brunensis TaxID=29422 RepID=A0A0W0S3Q8_9GAMM|nr:hypothetical protein [Legionella brunensis]KTC78094.1 periplasmic protein [Legionella brunensis]